MNIIVVHDNGFSVDNDSRIDEFITTNEDGTPKGFERYIYLSNLFHVIGEPKKECQVLTDNYKGYFCIFESNQKIHATNQMSKEEITQLKNNLKKWQ